MDLPQETDDYIKEMIDYSLGLPVSAKSVELKLQASEESRKRLQDQYFLLHSRLKEKDEIIEKSRYESSMNAQALKNFVEENQKLSQECSLYYRDQEKFMELMNEADERAKESEIRLLESEDELRGLKEELQFYKHDREMHLVNETKAAEELHLLRERINELECLRLQGCNHSQCSLLKTENQHPQPQILASMPGDSFAVSSTLEEQLLDSVIGLIVDKDGAASSAHAFLEANSGVESCQRLLKMWESLKLSTQDVIALAAKVKKLQNDKENLRINLTRAEEEAKVLFEENNLLDEENKRLLRLCNRERHHKESGGKHTGSASAKGSKRKSSPKMCSSIEGMIDFNGLDSPRQPLSPLQYNSPDSRMHKK